MQAGRVSGRTGGRAAMALLLATAAGCIMSSPVAAQAQRSNAGSFDIAPQPLNDALTEFGRQSGLQVSIDAGAIRGIQSPGVSGRMAPAEALGRLLAGTGFTFSMAGRIVTLERAPQAAAGSIALGPVRVEGNGAGRGRGQGSPSTDPIATEGTRSYTSRQVAMMKGATSRKDIPQSISVVTRQMMDDQNLVNLDDAMRTVTGITVEASSIGGNHGNFYSRGYAMDTIQVDGVSTAASTGNDLSVGVGLAIYDRIEVLRGPADLLQGAGDPGGTVNLVRKRAQKGTALRGQFIVGSWNRYYGEADATGSLNTDGSLRARVVIAYDDRGSFVDRVYTRKPLVFGTMDWDLTPDTTLTAGATFQRYTGRPFFGLPGYVSGDLLKDRRSTNLDPRWNHIQEDVTEYFASIDHRLANGGQIKLSGNFREQDEPDRLFGWSDCAIDPLTGDSCLVSWAYRSHWKNYALDGFLATPFSLFGFSHDLVIGADYRNVRKNFQYGGGDGADTNLYQPNIDVPIPNYDYTNGNISNTHQLGLYARTTFNLADHTKLVIGARLSWWKNHSINRNAYFNQFSETRTRINGRITPYAGMVVDLDSHLAAYASYTAIFSPQTITDVAGKLLAPRTGHQHEIGLKGEYLDGQLNGHVALFRMVDRNRSMTDPDNPLFSIAAGKMRNQGVEAEVTGSPLRGWDLTAGYAFTETKTLEGTEDQLSQQYVFITPRHTFNLWTKYSFETGALDGFSVGAGLRSVSSMKRNNGDVTFRQRPYSIVSLQAGYRVNRNIDANVTVNNLFDKEYYQRVWAAYGSNYYGEPRSVMFSIRANY